MRVCSLGPACGAGDQHCLGDEWGPCIPPDEQCNGLDDDCDGQIDEDTGAGAGCVLGEGQCFAEGRLACDAAGEFFCDARPLEPDVERCNGLDDDCDGSTDEGLGVGAPCVVGQGVCERVGLAFCGPDGEVVCDANPAQPAVEQCNGLDDDCDGEADEGLGVGDPCTVGVGACARPTQLDCNAQGGVSCVGVAGRPVREACNGADDDCDGITDEDFAVGAACTVSRGACEAPGVLACAPQGGTLCVGRPGEPAEETCNGVDDDCDGETDEGTDGGECVSQQGICAQVGTLVCRGVDGLVCDTGGFVGGGDVGDGGDGDLLVAGRVVLEARPYQFRSVRVIAGGTLTASAWDGVAGGTLDLRVQGELRIDQGGTVDVSGLGFAGGATNPKRIGFYANEWTNGGGTTGFHGGGPGGGGGGWSAPQQTVGSGGGGGHATPGANGTFCGADNRANYSVFDRNTGNPLSISVPPARFSSAGATYGDPTIEPALGPIFGSGGGAGGNNYDGGSNSVGGAGGNGGGALRIRAGSVLVEGAITARGGAGQAGVGGSYVGGGGGGAGGSVLLVAPTVTILGSIVATGGAGAPGSSGNGGGGGVGRLRIETNRFVRPGALDPAPVEAPHPCAALSAAGVQVDVPLADFTAAGFRTCFTGPYNVDVPIEQIQADCDQAVLTVACRPVGVPGTLTVAATGLRAEVFRPDAANTTAHHDHNGVSWYFTPGYSWGFAPAGAVLNRTECDVADAPAAQRLCWHTIGPGIGGYRCGAATGLNGSGAWERVILERPGAL